MKKVALSFVLGVFVMILSAQDVLTISGDKISLGAVSYTHLTLPTNREV